MVYNTIDSPAAWHVPEMTKDPSWRFQLDPDAQSHMARNIVSAFDPERELFDYRQADFDLGPGMDVIHAAARVAHFGCGLAVVKGLPRHQLSEAQFRILNWAIGLHLGVARPQGAKSQYLSEVRATGMNYRSPGGRGYNSNAALDFHTDGCDLVTLACYNDAKSGGQSMASSSVSAWNTLLAERPDLAEVARETFYFGRNTEEAPDEGPFYGQPLFDEADGRLFGKWNRNRVRTAQDLEGVPQMTPEQIECGELMDDILQRPQIMLTMWLEPGDLQIMNNHVMLHSRTNFEDFDEPEKKRLLYRLWLAPPDSVQLPDSWWPFFRSVEPGTVRGGIRGHEHNAACHAFEKRQAETLGMRLGSGIRPTQP